MAKRDEAGLTLIETLVGLALIGLIVTVLVAALRTGLAGVEMVDERAERLNELRLTQAFIRRHLGAARPVRWFIERRSVVAFDGRREAVSFVAIMPAWPDAGGLYLVRLAREGDRLVMTRRVTSGESQGFDFAKHGENVVLATGVAQLRFSYFGNAPRQRLAKWHEQWKGRTALPRVVRLDIDYARPAKGWWPTLVVETMIEPQPR